jgi:hypothetical protein
MYSNLQQPTVTHSSPQQPTATHNSPQQPTYINTRYRHTNRTTTKGHDPQSNHTSHFPLPTLSPQPITHNPQPTTHFPLLSPQSRPTTLPNKHHLTYTVAQWPAQQTGFPSIQFHIAQGPAVPRRVHPPTHTHSFFSCCLSDCTVRSTLTAPLTHQPTLTYMKYQGVPGSASKCH